MKVQNKNLTPVEKCKAIAPEWMWKTLFDDPDACDLTEAAIQYWAWSMQMVHPMHSTRSRRQVPFLRLRRPHWLHINSGPPRPSGVT